MKRLSFILSIIILMLFFSGCEKADINENPENTVINEEASVEAYESDNTDEPTFEEPAASNNPDDDQSTPAPEKEIIAEGPAEEEQPEDVYNRYDSNSTFKRWQNINYTNNSDKITDIEIRTLLEKQDFFHYVSNFNTVILLDFIGDGVSYPDRNEAREPFRDYSLWEAMIRSAFSDELAEKYLSCEHIWQENGITYTDAMQVPELVLMNENFDKYELLYNENGKASVKYYKFGYSGDNFVYTTEFSFVNDKWIISEQDIAKNILEFLEFREKIKNSIRENEYANGGYYIDGVPIINNIIVDNTEMTLFGIKFGDICSGFGIYMKKENKTIFYKANYVNSAVYDDFVCFDTEYAYDFYSNLEDHKIKGHFFIILDLKTFEVTKIQLPKYEHYFYGTFVFISKDRKYAAVNYSDPKYYRERYFDIIKLETGEIVEKFTLYFEDFLDDANYNGGWEASPQPFPDIQITGFDYENKSITLSVTDKYQTNDNPPKYNPNFTHYTNPLINVYTVNYSDGITVKVSGGRKTNDPNYTDVSIEHYLKTDIFDGYVEQSTVINLNEIETIIKIFIKALSKGDLKTVQNVMRGNTNTVLVADKNIKLSAKKPETEYISFTEDYGLEGRVYYYYIEESEIYCKTGGMAVAYYYYDDNIPTLYCYGEWDGEYIYTDNKVYADIFSTAPGVKVKLK